MDEKTRDKMDLKKVTDQYIEDAELVDVEYRKKFTDAEIDMMINNKMSQEFHRGGPLPTQSIRWTAADLMLRRQAIYDIYCRGYSITNCKKIMRERWGIADITAQRWYKDALDSITVDEEKMKEKYRNIQIGRLEKMIADCQELGKYKEAAMLMEQLSKLEGLYIDKSEVIIKDYQTTFKFGE